MQCGGSGLCQAGPAVPLPLHALLLLPGVVIKSSNHTGTNALPPCNPVPRLLDRVEVEVNEGWLQQMRLATAEPERAARLLMAGAAARGSGAGSSGGLLLEGPAATAAGAAGRCAALSGSGPGGSEGVVSHTALHSAHALHRKPASSLPLPSLHPSHPLPLSLPAARPSPRPSCPHPAAACPPHRCLRSRCRRSSCPAAAAAARLQQLLCLWPLTRTLPATLWQWQRRRATRRAARRREPCASCRAPRRWVGSFKAELVVVFSAAGCLMRIDDSVHASSTSSTPWSQRCKH